MKIAMDRGMSSGNDYCDGDGDNDDDEYSDGDDNIDVVAHNNFDDDDGDGVFARKKPSQQQGCIPTDTTRASCQ